MNFTTPARLRRMVRLNYSVLLPRTKSARDSQHLQQQKVTPSSNTTAELLGTLADGTIIQASITATGEKAVIDLRTD
jgi:hypothetical protein